MISHDEFKQAKSFIYSDIEREINLAKKGNSAGNLLCALALLCYTEFAGKLIYGHKGKSCCTKNFNGFFDNYLGGEYKRFRQKHKKIYEILRCGMAHGYFPQKNCTIAMLGKKSLGMKFEKDRYFFVIERYFEDFKKAFNKLEEDIFNIA